MQAHRANVQSVFGNKLIRGEKPYYNILQHLPQYLPIADWFYERNKINRQVKPYTPVRSLPGSSKRLASVHQMPTP
ncbi:serine/threonine protein kinase [Desmospora sp. 8437]|nr:serine/threonine protein kinase [Desmospora sp. 8437]